MRIRTLGLLFSLLASAAGPPLAAAQAAGERTGWYVVRPGDSIIGITRTFLGSSDRWLENWQLNPEVKDPNRIAPGQRLRILLGDDLPQRSARVATLSRKVEENPAPLDWADASRDDLLLRRDGVRTQTASSVELELTGGNRMTITENSLVYLKDARPAPVPVDRQAIEIVKGQADLEAEAGTSRPDDVEIIVAGSVAKPRSTAERPVQARARRPDQGGAQFMVYRGDSAVESAGKTVEVAQGMGTTVPSGGAPNPPEALLAAPPALSPEAGARLAVEAPTLAWEAVTGAIHYTVEVCRDPRCGELVQRVVAVQNSPWKASPIAPGKYFWRATAVSASGLDGYPGEPRSLEILDAMADVEPPTVSLRGQGRSLARGEVVHLGPGAKLEIEARDAASGIARREVTLDGRSVAPGVLEGPWESGKHELTFDVVDGAGNRSPRRTATFVYDPDPPTVSWQPVAPGWRGKGAMTTKAWPSGKAAAADVPLEWSGAGWGWQDLDRTWRADGPMEQLLLRA
ncbi:MAG: LysM peptidoglycan-binding domain-containing protein, partial [Acidobacteria bacterium]|nr:LysM peptidoglycan-binding domain-containing protein [Acidobacteriota bacterium]